MTREGDPDYFDTIFSNAHSKRKSSLVIVLSLVGDSSDVHAFI